MLCASLLSAGVVARAAEAADPVVANVQVAQRRDGSQLVDVRYDLTAAVESALHTVWLEVSGDGGSNWERVQQVAGDVGHGVSAAPGRSMVWDVGAEWPGREGTGYVARVVVTVSQANVAPVADAGPDQSVSFGGIVTLDGSASADADGGPLSFRWTAPVGIDLASTTSAHPSFTANVSGTLAFTLVVSDGMVDSAPDTVKVTVLAQPTTGDAVIVGQVVEPTGDARIIGAVEDQPIGDANVIGEVTEEGIGDAEVVGEVKEQ